MLIDYLTDNFTPERSARIMDALNLLTRFNIDDLDEKLEEAAFDRIDLDDEGRRQEINNEVITHLLMVLNEHDILINDGQYDLDTLIHITHTLKAASEDYDPEYLLARVNFELNVTNEAIDILANLVTTITGIDSDKVYDCIYRIENNVMVNLFNLLLDTKLNSTPIAESSSYLDRYKAYLNGRRYGIVYTLVKNGADLGLHEFNSLFLLVEDQLITLPRDELLYELISLILISNTDDVELNDLFVKVSKLMGENESECKLALSELKLDYRKNTGIDL